MEREKFLKLADAILDRARETLHRKGHDYAEDTDALDAFKNDGEEAGITSFQAWRVHAGKHWRALNTFVRVQKVESEGILGRVVDLINYAILFYGLYLDFNKGVTRMTLSQEDRDFRDKAWSKAKQNTGGVRMPGV